MRSVKEKLILWLMVIFMIVPCLIPAENANQRMGASVQKREGKPPVIDDMGWSMYDGMTGIEIFTYLTQHNGTFYLAGRWFSGKDDDYVLMKYTGEGERDPRFGKNGIVATDFGRTQDKAYALSLMKDGKILVGGHSCKAWNQCYMTLARYLPNGQYDEEFAESGKLVTRIAGQNTPRKPSISIQSDGRILVSALFCDAKNACQSLSARYLPDGSPDMDKRHLHKFQLGSLPGKRLTGALSGHGRSLLAAPFFQPIFSEWK